MPPLADGQTRRTARLHTFYNWRRPGTLVTRLFMELGDASICVGCWSASETGRSRAPETAASMPDNQLMTTTRLEHSGRTTGLVDPAVRPSCSIAGAQSVPSAWRRNATAWAIAARAALVWLSELSSMKSCTVPS